MFSSPPQLSPSSSSSHIRRHLLLLLLLLPVILLTLTPLSAHARGSRVAPTSQTIPLLSSPETETETKDAKALDSPQRPHVTKSAYPRVQISPGALTLTKDAEGSYVASGNIQILQVNDNPLRAASRAFRVLTFRRIFPIIAAALGAPTSDGKKAEFKAIRHLWKIRSKYMLARPYPNLHNWDMCVVAEDNEHGYLYGKRIDIRSSRSDVTPLTRLDRTRKALRMKNFQGKGFTSRHHSILGHLSAEELSLWRRKGYLSRKISFAFTSFLPHKPETLLMFAKPIDELCEVQHRHLHRDLLLPTHRRDYAPFLSVPGAMSLAIDSPDSIVIASDGDDTLIDTRLLQLRQAFAIQYWKERNVFRGVRKSLRCFGDDSECKGSPHPSRSSSLHSISYPHSLPKTTQHIVSAGSILMSRPFQETLQDADLGHFAIHLSPLYMHTLTGDLPDIITATDPREYKKEVFRRIFAARPEATKILIEDLGQKGAETLAEAYASEVERIAEASADAGGTTSDGEPNWFLFFHFPWPLDSEDLRIPYVDWSKKEKAQLSIERFNGIMVKHKIPPTHYYFFDDWQTQVYGKSARPENIPKHDYTSTADYIEAREKELEAEGRLAPPRRRRFRKPAATKAH